MSNTAFYTAYAHRDRNGAARIYVIAESPLIGARICYGDLSIESRLFQAKSVHTSLLDGKKQDRLNHGYSEFLLGRDDADTLVHQV